MKRFSYLVLFCLAIGLNSCVSFDPSELDNLNHGEVIRIGHAGSGFSSWIPFNYLPENSLISIKKALEIPGVDGVEIDLHMTADKKFVLYHDEKLDSKTNLNGCIEMMNYETIVKGNYQIGYPFDWFQSERVLGFKDLIDYFKSQEEFPLLHIDIRHHSSCFSNQKNGKWEIKVIDNLVAHLERMEVPLEKVLLIASSKKLAYHALEKEYPYPLSIEEHGTFEEGLDWVLLHGLKYLTIKPSMLTAEKVALAHKKGIYIITFGAKSKSGNKRLLELNPDFIQSNNLSALVELLDK